MYELYFRFKTHTVIHNTKLNRALCKVFSAVMRIYLNTIYKAFLEIQLRLGRIMRKKKNTADVVVSLTSFPARIETVHITIMTLLRQTVAPKRIILWLSKEQFPNGVDDLPTVLKLVAAKSILSIEFVEGDIRSYKKFVYILEKYPEENFITVDDDVFYPSRMIEHLMEMHMKYPDDVCCMSGIEINDICKMPSEWSQSGGLTKKLHHLRNIRIIGVGGYSILQVLFIRMQKICSLLRDYAPGQMICG